MSKLALKFLNGIYGWIIGIVIVAATGYAGYAIWDNVQIYKGAENVQSHIRQCKPNSKSGPGFSALKQINGDVIAWITLDGTNVDYPIVQGETNLEYMDKDVYGKYSLAGSIFLDTRNLSEFTDDYSLVYGHNMDQNLMFGDLSLYKNKKFFEANTTATLTLPDETKDMQVAAVLQISAGTDEIFNPTTWESDLNGFGQFVEANSTWYHSDLISKLESNPDKFDVVTLATCSEGDTNDRTVVVLVGSDDGEDISETEKATSTASDVKGHSPKTGDTQDLRFWIYLFFGSALFILLFEVFDHKKKIDD